MIPHDDSAQPKDVSADPDELAWDAAALLHEEAVALWRARREAEALPVAEAALAALTAAVGAGHPDTANAHDTLAEIHARLGNPRQALSHLRCAHALLEDLCEQPEVTPLRLSVANNLAFWLATAGDYAAAESLALTTLAETTDADVRYQASNTLGMVYRFQGRLEDAADAYERAASACGEAGRPVPATLLHNLAGLACACDAFVEAERYARAAIDARQREDEAAGQPDDAPGIGHAMDLCALADALAGQARHREAEAMYREALAIYRRVAPDNQEVGHALDHLGDLLATLGRIAPAEAAYREALVRKERAFGPSHHEVAGTLANLGALLASAGRNHEATFLVAGAVAMCRELLASDHPIRVGCETLADDLCLALAA